MTEPNPALVAALKALQPLSNEEFMAIATWMRGDGREALIQLGASQSDIGPERDDIDLKGTAQGKGTS